MSTKTEYKTVNAETLEVLARKLADLANCEGFHLVSWNRTGTPRTRPLEPGRTYEALVGKVTQLDRGGNESVGRMS